MGFKRYVYYVRYLATVICNSQKDSAIIEGLGRQRFSQLRYLWIIYRDMCIPGQPDWPKLALTTDWPPVKEWTGVHQEGGRSKTCT